VRYSRSAVAIGVVVGKDVAVAGVGAVESSDGVTRVLVPYSTIRDALPEVILSLSLRAQKDTLLFPNNIR